MVMPDDTGLAVSRFESIREIKPNHYALRIGGKRHYLDAEQAMLLIAAVSHAVASSVVVSARLADDMRTWIHEAKEDGDA
jgi:hypothetical protein